ncbi:MAG: alpha-amylase, partial [Chlorobi bacterium]|nr:alpha-amylase [Chlorobiota bacterium]
VFRNTEMVYSDEIGAQVADMGFKAILTEGPKQILGWKSPNFLYVNAIKPRLKVLMRNFKLSDDITFRFSNKGWSEYPLTAEKFVGWINKMDPNEEILNLFLDYETFGEHQPKETGIFEFLKALAAEVVKTKGLKFATPSEIINKHQPVSAVSTPYPISWADEERDLTAWLGNEMQNEAFDKLYGLIGRMQRCNDQQLIKDWNYLQVSDHFYYMSTKFFSDGEVHRYFNPYDSPYEAFINYMNVLSDFKQRLDKVVPDDKVIPEVASLLKIIAEKEEKIKKYQAEIKRLRKTKRKASRATKP